MWWFEVTDRPGTQYSSVEKSKEIAVMVKRVLVLVLLVTKNVMPRHGMTLTYWGRDKINNISQTTFSNVFSSIKMLEFRLKFYWSLFPRVQLTIFQHWFRSWLGGVQVTSNYLNQWWLVYRRLYASLGLNELITASRNTLVMIMTTTTLITIMS